jgi:2-polyprenyl-3-methyl-5-hydroxy-6-metoxy-1,4-benzoquinol methylase
MQKDATCRHCEDSAMSIVHRFRVPEVMDDPDLDAARHVAALRALARINALSRTSHSLLQPVLRLASERGCTKLSVLDVATGGGDVPIRLWRQGRRHGLELRIVAVDASPQAIAFGRARAAECGAPIEFREINVLAGGLPSGFDVVTCCLFLHHLDEEDVVALLRSMAAASNQLLLVSDLMRSRVGLMLAYVGTWTLTFSEVARVDGPRSVRAAFSLSEIRALATQAGLPDASIRRCWPRRYLLSWIR